MYGIYMELITLVEYNYLKLYSKKTKNYNLAISVKKERLSRIIIVIFVTLKRMCHHVGL